MARRKRSRTQFRGVAWHGDKRKWQAYINHLGKQYTIGVYDTDLEAAQAYNARAEEWHGEKAILNELPPDPPPPSPATIAAMTAAIRANWSDDERQRRDRYGIIEPRRYRRGA